ncbi:hypothetical protein ACQP2F_20220 [Actinoplanes sp. CA-030573]|uniref:hypothetical protein n=1 Tax=Actinoplanes sp. CA-030573 TaxID=3239898 RepID=UPI003D948919
MHKIFQGVRPTDYLLMAILTVAGVLLMVANVNAGDDASLAHPVSTTSWAIVPLFLLVTVPILWRRRQVAAVAVATAVAAGIHVLAFGYVTRCGVVLPLAFALAYAVARFARGRRDHLLGLAAVVVLLLEILARDASIDRVVDALPIALPGVALFYGAGLYVQNRVSRKRRPAAPAPVSERAAA